MLDLANVRPHFAGISPAASREPGPQSFAGDLSSHLCAKRSRSMRLSAPWFHSIGLRMQSKGSLVGGLTFSTVLHDSRVPDSKHDCIQAKSERTLFCDLCAKQGDSSREPAVPGW